jgi:hypothetical protein
MRRLGLRGAALVAVLAAVGTAAQAEPYGMRGTIVGVDDKVLTIMNADEETFEIALSEDTGRLAVTPAKWSEIEAGNFVGVTSIEAGNQRVALEVHIFAEDLRGVDEGHHPWDLIKDPNMMTNATVAEIEEVNPAQRQLRLTYRAGEGEGAGAAEQIVMVPDFVDVVFLAKSEDPDLIAPDRRAFVLVEDAEQGPPRALAIAVGLEGVTPPM